MSQNRDHFDRLLKIVLVGEDNTGKSSLLMRYSDEPFSDSYMPTIGVDFKIKRLEVDGIMCKLQMWDLAGQERFRTIATAYYRGASGALFVYDVSRRSSFEGVQNFFVEMINYGRDEVPALLVANKMDLDGTREVSTEEGEELASQFGMGYVEVSAKSGLNLESAFAEIARRAKDNIASNLRGDWQRQYIFVTPEMWTADAIHDSAALVITL